MSLISLCTRRLAPGISAFACLVAFGQTRDVLISIEDGRPLAKLADEIERVTGVLVNYEDAPYGNSADVADLTEAVSRMRSTSRVLVPRQGSINVTLHMGGSDAQNDVAAGLSAAISQHIAKRLPGLYALHENDNAMFIDPIQVLDAHGVMASSPSILATPVSIPYKERTEFETLETVLAEVARQAGVRIGAGMGPWGWLTESKLMFYDPGLKLYVFNVNVPAQIETATPTLVQSSQRTTGPSKYALPDR